MNINWKPTYIPGDLVYNHKGEVIRITSSYLKGTRLFYYKTDEISESTGCILEEALKPIPLTPEFLKKNGWKKFKRPYSRDYCFRRKSYPTLNIRSNNEVYFHWGDHDKSITAVHQLQHLLFGLGLNSEMEV